MSIDRVLNRLTKVKQTGSYKWRASCPAHDSSSRSLAIADQDGRVLIHCFAGCTADAVLSSVGLSFSDLYDKPIGEFPPLKRGPFNARDVVDLVLHEAMTVAIITSDFLRQRQISPPEAERLFSAMSRLNHIIALVDRECR
jgi:hypothetical protein